MKDIEDQIKAYAQAVTAEGASASPPVVPYGGPAQGASSPGRGWYAAAASVAVLFLIGGLLVTRGDSDADPTLASTTTTTELGEELDVASTTTATAGEEAAPTTTTRVSPKVTSTTALSSGLLDRPDTTSTTVESATPPSTNAPIDGVQYVVGMPGFRTTLSLPTSVIRTDEELQGELILYNTSGTAVWYEACGEPYTALISEDLSPRYVPADEIPCTTHMVTIPVGESHWPLVVRAIPYKCAFPATFGPGRSGRDQSWCAPDPGAPPVRSGQHELYIASLGPWTYADSAINLNCHAEGTDDVWTDGLPNCWDL